MLFSTGMNSLCSHLILFCVQCLAVGQTGLRCDAMRCVIDDLRISVPQQSSHPLLRLSHRRKMRPVLTSPTSRLCLACISVFLTESRLLRDYFMLRKSSRHPTALCGMCCFVFRKSKVSIKIMSLLMQPSLLFCNVFWLYKRRPHLLIFRPKHT